MKTIRLQKRSIDPVDYRDRLATELDCSLRIDEPCIVYVEGSDGQGSNLAEEPAIVYLELDESDSGLAALAELLQGVTFPTKQRTRGMISTSKTFGYQPRKIVQGKEACHTAAMTHEFPAASTAVCSLASRVAAYYQMFNPAAFARHQETVAQVLPMWRLGESPFTSGIVNKDNQLPYHYDAGNFKGVWSNMICLKDGIEGGNLSCPELDATFVLKNNSIIMFDGQGLLHGVTPFKKKRPRSYRYTVVYYSLAAMWMCKPPEEEIVEAAKRRRLRELKRANLQRAGARSESPTGGTS